MSEFVGLGYYAEIPAVIFDVQRVGPSTGLPTRTAQGDMLIDRAALARRHASTRCSSPPRREECFRMAIDAFDLAEQLPDAGLRDDRSRPGHEQLDVRPVRRIPRSRSSAARC